MQQGLLRSLADYADIPAFVKPAAHPHTYNIIVVSTTGDGDPPETIRPFMRLLRKKDPKKLEGLRYGVLALGDTNYENFCNTGKRIDTALPKLGAERFLKRGDADDGVGLEIVVEPWLKSMWVTLQNISSQLRAIPPDLSLISEETTSLPVEEPIVSVLVDELEGLISKISIEELGFNESSLPKMFPPKTTVDVVKDSTSHRSSVSVNPSYIPEVVRHASVTNANILTSPDCEKTVWHMEVTCDPDTQMKTKYRPGDAFGVITENHPSEVERFLKVLNLDRNQLLRLHKENGEEVATATVLQFVQQRIDLRAIPKKTLIRAISEYCHDVEERKALLHLCSRDGRRKYTQQVTKSELSILRLIEEMAKSCRAPLSLFLDQLPSVAPRWYSATSSPELDGENTLHFAFSVVKSGLATNSLSRFCERYVELKESAQVLLIPRDSDSTSFFRPPASLQTSYIMIGPGTGVAPFRGFLRERLCKMQQAEEKDFGRTILFFGCRYRTQDFLYEKDLYDLQEKGALSMLDVAFSRDFAEKEYVQDRLKACAKDVAEIVKSGGSIYVCGDGGGMAQGVHLALSEILAEFCCDENAEEGKSMLRQLAEEHRYVRDIWFYG
ncbi:unnamed protein product [Agarophyton chilense]